ncbi:carbohydrate ABC transporter permease [Paenibacillus sp. GCM10023252]|uniref:carbohydrate ABC transporter permease n=1 Tax=Paenibacillus sp. GCM10023252 TaxID=3252649 RepID=UPI003623EBD0
MNSNLVRRFRKHWIGYVFVSPWCILFAVFGLWPILYALYLSLHNTRLMQRTSESGLTLYNYTYLFTDSSSDLLLTIRNTLIYVLFHIPTLFLTALLLAYLLNRKLRFEAVWKTMIFLPIVTAGVVYAMMWKSILGYNGLLNEGLRFLGLGSLNLLSHIHTAMPTVAIVDALKQAPYWTIILISALTSVSAELYDSATIDGATSLQKFTRITLPMIAPVIFFMLFMLSIGAWNAFEQVFVLTQGGPDNASLTITYYLYSLFSRGRIGMAAAVGIVIGLLVMLTTILVRRLVKTEDHYQ